MGSMSGVKRLGMGGVGRMGLGTDRALPALFAALCGMMAVPAPGEAQVVLSAGVNETYDDNIFLESGDGAPPIIIQDSQIENPDTSFVIPEEADGKKNDDFLTDVHVGASAAPTWIRGVKSALGATVGGIFFADQTDYDRATLNADFSLSSQRELIPDPFFVNLSSQIRSQSNDASIAQGTATRTTEVLYGSLDTGVRGIDLTRDTTWGAGYRFGYVDYLGDFTFNNKAEDRLGAFENRLQNRGSDYITNGVSTTFDEQLTKRLTGTLAVALTDISFTSVDSSGGAETERNQLDRDELVPSLSLRYLLSREFSADGSVGYNITRYKNDPEPLDVVVVNDDGSQTLVNEGQSKNRNSFVFSTGIGYSPDPGSAVRLGVNQSTTPDLNGNRLVTRAVTLTGTESFTDRLRANASGRFLQYDLGSTLQNPSERYEFTIALQYSITPSVALNTGYTFADQHVQKDDLDERVLLSAEDYQSNRFFLGVSAGFIGLMN